MCKDRVTYFIPEVYKCQNQCQKDNFWTPKRISREPFNGSYNVMKWIAEREKCLIGKKLLDIGCGPATKLAKFFPDARIYGIDTLEAVRIACEKNKSAEFFDCDLDDMTDIEKVCKKLDTIGKFDCIISIDVIEHIMHPENILFLIRKYLDEDGIAYIGTLERDLSRGQDSVRLGSVKLEHVREWNQKEFYQFITSEGFVINECKITWQAVHPNINTIKIGGGKKQQRAYQNRKDKNFRVQTFRCSLKRERDERSD